MNNTTRSLIFFTGLLAIIFYYFSIIPMLPFAMEQPTFYINYLAASLLLVFPWIQLIMRKGVLKKYKLKDESLFQLAIHDAKAIHRITFYAIAFLVILFPATGNKLDLKALLPVHYFTFAIWLFISELWIYVTYKTTKAYFGREYILISGLDFRLDFPFGSMLYSHSGVYHYTDFKYYYIEGQIIYLVLENEQGKIAVEAEPSYVSNITSYLSAQKVKAIKPY
ncbi:hypothetical protein [Fusibacter ferrireducens]|uniref:DUF5673 domain-containing protein n=1 Tax=Fusibacter ferrireducens TaxID=2785058 RepID=A0ABR9ZY19_9FIRM|nr:hypothetical protein [Fusibacter ferrireducens]MBF4695367.1 hypothetical protein [Fusibacter ferrireducens]